MTKIQSYFEQVLKPINTDIVLRSITPCFTVDFVSEYHEHDFTDWVENCLNLTEHCVRDLELLLIKGTTGELNHIQKAGEISKLVGDSSVSVLTMKDIDGICLVGTVYCMIYMIPELQQHFQNISFWNL